MHYYHQMHPDLVATWACLMFFQHCFASALSQQ